MGALIVEGAEDPEIFEAGGVTDAAGGGSSASSGTTSTTAAPAAAAAAAQVIIPEGAYDPENAATAYGPKTVRIKVGDTVEWIDDDIIAHTVAADDDSFDSENLKKGKRWRHTFKNAGTYNYHCTPHPFMKGTVIVEE